MDKRARVMAALRREPVDRPPVSFWRHVPDLDHTAPGLADAMLAFHRRWDLDFVKVMSSGVYCVEDWGCQVAYQGSPNGAKQCTRHAVQARSDWGRIRALDPGAGALGRELEAVRLIARGRSDDAPILHTLFSPLTVARKLAGDRVVTDLREDPGAVEPALDAIAETMARHAQAALSAGADGLFFATQTAAPDVVTADESARFELPRMRRILDAVAGRSAFTLLHVHGRAIYFDQAAGLPVHAINWHDRLTAPRLGDAHGRFSGALVGGLSESRTLLGGPPEAVAAEVRDAIDQTGGRGLMVGPGCVLPLATPDAHLTAVLTAVKAATPR
ncbi:MAG TPA: uroporphyrinogen decarboxylase family protein [Candidatus Nitrosotalea sp.]|nr:uroporphyrinogen decarboxylase family protein [Candidatus Nitrosotalea sp.]